MSQDEWFLAEKVVQILAPFQDATKKISEHSTCLSDIIPLIRSLRTIIEHFTQVEGVKTLAKDLLAELERRFEFLKTNETYIIATVLDARYKNCLFDQEDFTFENILSILKNSDHLPLSLSAHADSVVSECTDDNSVVESYSNSGNLHGLTLAEVNKILSCIQIIYLFIFKL